MSTPYAKAAIQSKAVDSLVARIVEIAHPLKIVLFGSAARNELHAESDIDVLVVMPDGTRRRQVAQMLYRQIRGLGVPFDILVATPMDLRKLQNNPGLIYRDLLKEGREVYAA